MGRLPVVTVGQLEAVLRKIVAYEDNPGAGSNRALLVADVPDGAGNFEADMVAVEGVLAGAYGTEYLKASELTAGHAAGAGAVEPELGDGPDVLSGARGIGPARDAGVSDQWGRAAVGQRGAAAVCDGDDVSIGHLLRAGV